MQAVQVVEAGTARLVEVADPEPRGEALVRMRTVGLCGTDSGIVSGRIAAKLPVILGHEGVGEIVESEPGGALEVGQRVLVDPAVSCGECRSCSRGYPNLCLTGGLLGRDFDGLFAEYASIPERQLLTVPETIAADEAGLLQVLGTCVHAMEQVSVEPGDVAVVIGLGVGGQLTAQLLSGLGATVIGVTRSAGKRDLAIKLGAVAAVEPTDAQDATHEISGGYGAQVVVEAAGTERTLSQAITLAAPRATVVMYGTPTEGNEGLPYYELYFKELTIRCPRAATRSDYRRAIDLVASGAISTSALVSERFDLTDANLALAAVAESGTLKILMTPG